MDDASTDATPEIARAFGDAITYYRQSANRGQFRNVEDGIARATGQYIAVYHADDIYDPDIVASEVEFLETNPDVGLVFSLIRLIDGVGREYGRLDLPRSLRSRGSLGYADVLNGVLTYKNVFLPTPGAMARADLYAKVGGFRTEFGSAADLDMWLRCARLGRIGLVEQHLLRYRHTAGSVAQSYQIARTEPENFFAVVEREIAEYGGEMVTPAARRAFKAHRAVDGLRICVNHYIRGDVTAARITWRGVPVHGLLASGKIRRPRHLLLWSALGVLCRLPHIPRIGSALHWRYYRRLPWWERK